MQPGINIDAIKQYNASLKEYKEKSSKLRAEIEFNQKELTRQCSELSAELGIEVTPDNIQQILQDHINKINNTVSVGTEIIERIRAEEKMLESGQYQNLQSTLTSTSDTSTTNSSGINEVQNAQVQTPLAAAQSTVPSPPIAPGIPDDNATQQTVNVNDLIGAGLPPLFQNNGISI